ncbi:electron transport complex subunit RsxG [Candidatus Pantoea carbekii]|uniref:Ion-translocating oxidoreductase complex subunit G n=1 Tax=Candidatus Pantoea carbekii TaxID=1235990 RepID=U3U8D3_9GAMM|nr:electron transport complex subunit RsxG [Candidatus Pantoea carbekii]AKC32083.1 electron transport complex protein RnfG [Candidatus Pantoea carbekii]BAO00609.1 RnfG protein [Candidatus Pantoea carbekii]
MIKIIRKNALTLAIFAAITTGLIAVIHYITECVAKNQILFQQKKLLDQVIPTELYDNQIQQECYLIKDKVALGNNKFHHLYLARKGNTPVAAAIETVAPDGYAGPIQMLVGATFEGKILGVRVTEYHETPGFGDKVELRVSNWINSFNGQVVHDANDKDFAIKKDGGRFDQFTGATITPRAVVNATKRTTLLIKTLPDKLSSLPKCG